MLINKILVSKNTVLGLAFSILAGLAPVFGLYTSFFPVLFYTLMGTSKHISIGTFAVTSLLTRASVERLVPSGSTDSGDSTLLTQLMSSSIPNSTVRFLSYDYNYHLV